MKPVRHPITAEAAAALLAVVTPGSRLVSAAESEGSYSNTTHVLTGLDPDGNTFKVVARRYATFADYDLSAKARREYRTLEVLHAYGLPVPEPLYLDAEGALLGSPGIVTRFVEGESVRGPDGAPAFAERLAQTLAAIHAVRCAALESVLLDGRAEVLWFLQGGSMPPCVATHPLGLRVWEAARRLAAHTTAAPTSLVHVDYWTGNIVWQDGAISAVLDWEEAACGEPGMDVAYCQLELSMSGHPETAKAFLTEYERLTGGPVPNLALWRLAASVRPMFDAEGWSIMTSPYGERLATFIETTLELVGEA